MDTQLKDCMTCKHHQGKQSIDDIADECFPCVHHRNTLGYYPNWEPAPEASVEMVWQDKRQDNVNSPKHYTQGGIETIDFIKAKLGIKGTIAYCMGNVIKYVARWQDKGGLEDLKKAQWYLNYAINLMKENDALK